MPNRIRKENQTSQHNRQFELRFFCSIKSATTTTTYHYNRGASDNSTTTKAKRNTDRN